MEQGLGQDSIPASGSFDKSRVLSVRPLRSLVPIFPSPSNYASFSPPQGAPFFCVPPNGPFPPGVAPFYPFFVPPESQRVPEQNQQTPFSVPNQAGPFGFTNPIQAAVPLNSYKAPPPPPGQYSGAENGEESDAEETSEMETPKGKSRRRARGRHISLSDVEVDSMVNNLLNSSTLTAFGTFLRAEGDKESVQHIRMIYDLLRRRITQVEDSKEATPGGARRPDLRAGTVLMNKGIRTNINKRIGTVPGIEVGDIFFYRMELCVVGLHAPIMAGIDYMSLRYSQEEEPLAVSIVSSGGYEDNEEDGDVLIYSGQGGNIYRKDKDRKISDQKLERGNLALEKSLHRANEVRVLRGIKDLAVASVNGKVYVYDGLYKIQESWVDKGKSGTNVFKYKLVRVPGQPEAFTMWKSIQQWREGIISRNGVILPDLTSGAENLPVSLVNDIDNEKGPAYFAYISTLKCSRPVSSVQSSFCTCQTGCHSGDLRCSCVQRNGGYLPYIINGVLVIGKSLIYECGPSCLCPPNCRNRTSQGGLKVRLEVFKTKEKGWGLRSWDPIRAGYFICEYAGEVIDNFKDGEIGSNTEDEFIFDGTRSYQPLEVLPGDSSEAPKIPFPLIISAKNGGNIARFMNHSCCPNVFWQPIMREDKNESFLHIAFFAIRHIPPMAELTYDYGIVQTEKADQRRKTCLCGSSKCRGYYY